MPYPRMGDTSDGGIDWTQVITTGEQVIGGIIHPGNTIPSRYPVYTPTSTAIGSLSSPTTLLVIAAVAYLALRKR